MNRTAILLVVFAVFFVGAILCIPKPVDMAILGGTPLKIEYAATPSARELGLGGRAPLPQDSGMLFIFTESDRYGFWMKDMHFPIDIFWLNDQGQVVAVEQNIDPSTYPNVFYPPVPVRYVLETNAGFAKEHAIQLGAKLELKNMPTVSK